MFSKYVKKIIILLPVLLLFFAVPVSAAESGVPEIWDGTFTLNSFVPNFMLNLYRPYSYIHNSDNSVVPVYTSAYYSYDDNFLININSDDTNVYLNGSFKIRVTVSPSVASSGLRYLNVSCTPLDLNDVYVTVLQQTRVYGGISTFDIIVEFDNYFVNDSEITLPISVSYNLSSFYTTLNENIPLEIQYDISYVSDYHGSIYQYDSLEDVPSLDGYFAEQNQQIINNSSTQITVTQQQTEQQHADSQAQIQATQTQTDTLVNGYDSTAGQGVVNNFNDVAGSLEDAENDLFASADLGGINYDPFSEYITSDSAQAGFSFIRSVLQALWNALGDFQIPIYLGLLLMIVTKFLGFQQFASGGGD